MMNQEQRRAYRSFTEKVLDQLQDNPRRVIDIADCLGVSKYRVYIALGHLTRRGLVKSVQEGRWALSSYDEPVVPSPQMAPDLEPGQPVVTVIGGVVYESIWAGKDPLPGSGAAQGLGATLSGSSFKAHV